MRVAVVVDDNATIVLRQKPSKFTRFGEGIAFWHTVVIFQLTEFIDVTVFVTGGTLFVTGPHSTRKMITWRLVS